MRASYGITYKVHAPSLVHCQGRHERHAHTNAFGLFTLPDGQALSGVDAVHPFVIDVGVLCSQNVVDHAVAPTSAGVRGLDDLVAQLHIERTGLAHMAQGVSA